MIEKVANQEILGMIRESADAVGTLSDLSRIRKQRFHGCGFDSQIWRQMAELGWVGALVPADKGGLGLGIAALAVLAEELGARLVPEPLIETAVAASLLTGPMLERLVGGAVLILPAWQSEPNQITPLPDVEISAGFASGVRRFIYGGAAADIFLVINDQAAALVERSAQGLSLDVQSTQDGGTQASLSLQRVSAEVLDISPEEIAIALDNACLATAAYSLGLMERAFNVTLEYLRARRQFGKVIGSFQALHHRAADLKLQIELSRASIASAVAVLEQPGLTPSTRQRVVSRAKARASDSVMLVTRQCIQLHGGIGFTDEHDIGLFLRRAMVIASRYGGSSSHRQRFDEVAGVAHSN